MNRFLSFIVGLMGLLLITPDLSAQNGFEVRGTVMDQTGQPVIGATVLEKGTTNGLSTDIDGNYTLKVSSADAIVEISCIGYKTVTFVAKTNPAKTVIQEDAMYLDDVVVIGYGTVKKSDMTGSVTAINAEEVNRGAVTSPSSMLLGKVSGLNITPANGQPGSSSTIRIRGAASLTASNDPLIVIDGVPVTKDGGAGMGDPLATVNPNDIESYSVLKDASATANLRFPRFQRCDHHHYQERNRQRYPRRLQRKRFPQAEYRCHQDDGRRPVLRLYQGISS